MGRRLRGLLIGAGFDEMVASSSAESHGTSEDAVEAVRSVQSILEDPEFIWLASKEGWGLGAGLRDSPAGLRDRLTYLAKSVGRAGNDASPAITAALATAIQVSH